MQLSELKRFFSALEATSVGVRRTRSEPDFGARLGVLFQSLSETGILAPQANLPAPVPASVNVAALTEFLGALGEPIKEATESGHFLNVWSLAGVRRDELRNAALLCWLLDSSGTHGRGDKFWQQFLRRMADELPRGFAPDACTAQRFTARLETYPLANTERRVDIELENDHFLAFVEVKVDAAEGRDQIGSYVALAAQKAHVRPYCVFLICPIATDIERRDHVAVASWRIVADAIDDVIRNDKPSFAKTVLQQLSRHYAEL